MSTRAQIGFYQSEQDPIDTPGTVYVYQHSDGYPEGVLPLLEPFAHSFQKRRGLTDTAYATARCIVALAQARDAETKRALEMGIPGSAVEKVDYLGLGADAALHPDIEFFYHVSPTRIAIYKATYAGGSPPEFHLQHTLALTPPPAQSPSLSAEAR